MVDVALLSTCEFRTQIDAGKIFGYKWNYTYACPVKPRGILKVKRVKTVWWVTECICVSEVSDCGVDRCSLTVTLVCGNLRKFL